MPWKSKDEAFEAVPALKGLETEAKTTIEQLNEIANTADKLETDGKVDNGWAVAIDQFKQYYTIRGGKWINKKDIEAAEPQWVEIARVGEYEWKGALPDGIKNLPDYEKRIKIDGDKAYLVLDEDYLKSVVNITLPFMQDVKKLKEKTGLTGIRMFRQDNGEHEFTRDGSFAVYRDLKFEAGALMGFAEFAPDASDVLNTTGQKKQSIHITEIGGLYPFMLCSTATATPRVSNVAEMKLSEEGAFEISCDGADRGGQALIDEIKATEPQTMKGNNMEEKIKELEAKIAELEAKIAEKDKEIEEMKKPKEEVVAEAALPETLTREDLEKILEEKKAEWEKEKAMAEKRDAIEASIIPAMREPIKKVMHGKGSELVLSENVKVDISDGGLLAALEIIKDFEQKTGAPVWPKLGTPNIQAAAVRAEDIKTTEDKAAEAILAKMPKREAK